MPSLPTVRWMDVGVFSLLALVVVLAHLRLDGLLFGAVVVLGLISAGSWYLYRWLQSFLGQNRVVDPASDTQGD